jgi:hypothetical protein
MHVAALRTVVQGRPVARPRAMPRLEPLLLMAGTLLGFALRLPLLDRFPLHPDEAIYGVWALHLWRDDPLLLQHWPDKPPLFLWLLGGTLHFFGASQASARWLNLALSTLTIPIVGLIAGQLWGRRAALAASFALALNPFAISFAPTVFTDPLLVLAGSLALLAALQRRSAWAGLWLGVAIMTKQQGVLYAPLVIALLATQKIEKQNFVSLVASFVAGLALIVLPILYWDSLRWAVAPSPWDLSVRNYGALALVPISAWPERWQAWGELFWHLTASWPLWLILVVGSITVLLRQQHTGSIVWLPNWQLATGNWQLFFSLWSIAYLALHLVTTVQVWDRYLLPLVPMVALWIGWLAGRWQNAPSTKIFDLPANHLDRRGGFIPSMRVGEQRRYETAATAHKPSSHFLYAVLNVIMALALLPPAWSAARGELPVGGDHGAYAGLREALMWVRQNRPADTVLYHHTLGWQAHFYLYDDLAEGQVELRWFPHAVSLVDNAHKTPHRHKVWIEPDWSPVRDLALQARVRGLLVQTEARFGHFTVYELVLAPQPPCPWCVCAPRSPFPPLLLDGDGERSCRP